MRLIIILMLTFTASGNLFSQDLMEWRGPNRTGIYPDQNLLKSWPESGPELLLEIDGIGTGYSSPVVYGNTIYVCGRRDSLDIISAIDINGSKKWETAYGKSWDRTYPETRCTPTIENNRIYLSSGMGEVVCIDAPTGKIIWKVDAHNEYKGEYHNWGVSESIAISDKAVFYITGGNENSVISLDKTNGKLLWRSKSLGGPHAYASSLIIEKAGLRILIAQTARDLIGINIENGEVLWNYDIIQYHTGQRGRGANTNTPLFYNDEIFITSGYDHPALMFSLAADGRSISLKWMNNDFDSHMGGAVKIGGHIYGSSHNNGNGTWVCVEWATGSTMYDTPWFSKGPIIAADGLLYCIEEKSGHIALVKPNPEKFELISYFKNKKSNGPYWAHPAIFDGKLFDRHGDNLLVYNLKD